MITLADLSHTLVEHRDCGDCRVCCVLPAIDTPKLRKPAGTVCQHHTGASCGIYAERLQAPRGLGAAAGADGARHRAGLDRRRRLGLA